MILLYSEHVGKLQNYVLLDIFPSIFGPGQFCPNSIDQPGHEHVTMFSPLTRQLYTDMISYDKYWTVIFPFVSQPAGRQQATIDQTQTQPKDRSRAQLFGDILAPVWRNI